jgi:phosphate transport system permease protein
MSRSIFTAIIMLSFMIIPTMTSLVLNQLNNISTESLKGSMALGNTKTYAIYRVVKKEIHNGIVVAAIVSFGRAIGETMAISLILTGGVHNPFSGGVFGLFTQG